MTHDDVQNWLDKYIDAWRSEGTSKLAALFTNDATYKPSPWRQGIEGLDAVGKFWEMARSGPDESFEIKSEIVALENRTAIARISVEYADEALSRWRDLWIIEFDQNKLCRSFEEWPFSPEQDDGQAKILGA